MSRDEETHLDARADEAKRRLFCGIKRSKVLIEEYRRRLLVLRGALPAPNSTTFAAAPRRSHG